MISVFDGKNNTYGPVRIYACRTFIQTVTRILSNFGSPKFIFVQPFNT